MHEIVQKKGNWWGGRTEEMRRQKREKDRKKESLVLWSEAACQRLPSRHCALMIPHTSETNSEDDDHRFICCLWPHYCHSTLGQQLGSGEGGRKKEKDTEKSKKRKHFDLWSIIYFQSNAFTRLHLRNTGGLWSLFQQVTTSQSPPSHSYSSYMFRYWPCSVEALLVMFAKASIAYY